MRDRDRRELAVRPSLWRIAVDAGCRRRAGSRRGTPPWPGPSARSGRSGLPSTLKMMPSDISCVKLALCRREPGVFYLVVCNVFSLRHILIEIIVTAALTCRFSADCRGERDYRRLFLYARVETLRYCKVKRMRFGHTASPKALCGHTNLF